MCVVIVCRACQACSPASDAHSPPKQAITTLCFDPRSSSCAFHSQASTLTSHNFDPLPRAASSLLHHHPHHHSTTTPPLLLSIFPPPLLSYGSITSCSTSSPCHLAQQAVVFTSGSRHWTSYGSHFCQDQICFVCSNHPKRSAASSARDALIYSISRSPPASHFLLANLICPP